MSKNKYFYSIDDDDSCYEIETVWDIDEDGEYLAQDSADDFHSDHDGWEDAWPLIINLHKEDEGTVINSYSVDREYDPVFSASLIVEPQEVSENDNCIEGK